MNLILGIKSIPLTHSFRVHLSLSTNLQPSILDYFYTHFISHYQPLEANEEIIAQTNQTKSCKATNGTTDERLGDEQKVLLLKSNGPSAIGMVKHILHISPRIIAAMVCKHFPSHLVGQPHRDQCVTESQQESISESTIKVEEKIISGKLH